MKKIKTNMAQTTASGDVPKGWDPKKKWIGEASKITPGHVEEIVETIIIKTISFEDACLFCAIDPEAMKKHLKSNKGKASGQAIRRAEAARRVKLIEDSRDRKGNAQKLLEFLEPMQKKEFKHQLNIEITYLLHVVKQNVSDNQWNNILGSISNEHNAQEALDIAERIYLGAPPPPNFSHD